MQNAKFQTKNSERCSHHARAKLLILNGNVQSLRRKMYCAIHDRVYQHVRFRFARADDYEQVLKAVISKNFASAEHLDVETTSAAMLQIYQNASHEEYLCTRNMFQAAFVFMLSYYWYEQLALDEVGLVEAYPDFYGLEERELEFLLAFRNMLHVSMLIFDPHESKEDFLSMLCGVCGVTESFLTSQPDMAASFLEVFEQETAIPHIQARGVCAIHGAVGEVLQLKDIQQQWDEVDQSELMSSAAATKFWHHHCLLILTGRDIPCINVPEGHAGYAGTLPPHDLDWTPSLPEQTPLPYLQQTTRTGRVPPSPPAAGDYHTNYAAQLVQFTQRQAEIYQSGHIPAIEPMIVSQHTTPTHAQQSDRSSCAAAPKESPATSPKT